MSSLSGVSPPTGGKRSERVSDGLPPNLRGDLRNVRESKGVFDVVTGTDRSVYGVLQFFRPTDSRPPLTGHCRPSLAGP